MRVLIYTRVNLLGQCLVEWLSTQPDVTEAATCLTASNLLRDLERISAELVLFDVREPESLREARIVTSAAISTPLLAISVPETADAVLACAEAGFVGYVPNQASLQDLGVAMRRVLKGECACPPHVSGALLRELRRRAPTTPGSKNAAVSLTRREAEILDLLSRGMSNKDISKKLHVSIATVKNHVHKIFNKLGVRSRAEALARVRDEPGVGGQNLFRGRNV